MISSLIPLTDHIGIVLSFLPFPMMVRYFLSAISPTFIPVSSLSLSPVSNRRSNISLSRRLLPFSTDFRNLFSSDLVKCFIWVFLTLGFIILIDFRLYRKSGPFRSRLFFFYFNFVYLVTGRSPVEP